MADDLSSITRANRAAWDASAELHLAGTEWQELKTAAALPDFCTFDDTLRADFKSLAPQGKRVVQVGCNNGRELLSVRALGAIPALGIDQSSEFLKQAELLAGIAGVECRFLCTDIYELPADVPRDFDIGLITIGVLSWMPDLPRFFQVVASLLTPGAALLIYESHPVLEMFEPESDTPYALARSYFDKAPYVSSEAITYDGTKASVETQSYWFMYTLGEIVTGAVSAGLTVERLTEYPHSNREVEYDKYTDQTAQLPMCYTLILRKCA